MPPSPPYAALDMADWDTPLPADEREALLNRAAHVVVARGLEAPAIFMLEMHKPLAFVASQSLVVAAPLFGPLLGPHRVQQLSRLLHEPGSVDDLIRRIEERAVAAEPVLNPTKAPAE